MKQNKVQYNLDRQIVKISALLSGSVSKYEFLTDKDILLGIELLEKAAAIKRFEYSLLGKELKAHKDIVKDQCKLSKDQKIMLLITIKKMVIKEKKIRVVKLILLKSLM